VLKKFDDTFSCIDTTPACDGWTNRQTDSVIFNDLERPLSEFSRHYLTLNGTRYRQILIMTYTRPTEVCHFEWPSVNISLCDSRTESQYAFIFCDGYAISRQHLSLSAFAIRECNPGTRVPENPGNPPVFKPVNPGLFAVKNPGFTGLI